MKDFDLAEAGLELLGQLPRNVIPSATPSGSPGSVRPDGELSNNHDERSLNPIRSMRIGDKIKSSLNGDHHDAY